MPDPANTNPVPAQLVQPAQAPLVAMAAAAAGNLAGANQLTVVPLFSGEGDVDVQYWAETVDVISVSFAWADVVTLATVKARLAGKAADFVRTLREMNDLPDVWQDVAAVGAVAAIRGFRTRLVDRFRKDKGIMSLADTVSKLIQKPSEGVEDFFDRCVMAYSRLNVDFVDKAAPGVRSRSSERVSRVPPHRTGSQSPVEAFK